MDISSTTSAGIESVGAVAEAQSVQVAQAALLKQVIETEAGSALALVQSVSAVTGSQPLELSGNLGTRVNELV